MCVLGKKSKIREQAKGVIIKRENRREKKF